MCIKDTWVTYPLQNNQPAPKWLDADAAGGTQLPTGAGPWLVFGKQVSVQGLQSGAEEQSQPFRCPMFLPQPPVHKTRLACKPTAAPQPQPLPCVHHSLACMPCRQPPPQQATAQALYKGCVLGYRVASQQQT